MKRNLIGTLSLVALSMLLATGANAQSAAAKADVPFAFTAWKTDLPAGCYVIRQIGQLNAVTIQDCQTHRSVLSPIQGTYTRDTQTKLVFHRIGEQYFLSQIRGVNGGGMALPASKLEKEMQMADSAPNGAHDSEMITIALK